MRLIYLLFSTILAIASGYRNELVLLGDEKIGQVIKTSVQYKKAEDLPTHWDYRDLGLLTQDLNQHIPVYW